MEGKAVLFKTFGDVDAIPILVDTKDTEEIVNTILSIAPTFGGINLEDISAPRCFEIEKKLKEKLSIPVFHDDQHGTAIVVLAALLNAMKIVKKPIHTLKVIINGSGAAGNSIAKLLMSSGISNVIMCDRKGALYRGMEARDAEKQAMAEVTNPYNAKGTLPEVIVGADVFIGVSAGGVLTKEMVQTMGKDAVVFAMANPTPEIFPEEARAGGARIIGTGRSDYPNQINNVLAFPGIFRGALDVRASEINEEMKVAAAYAIANSISEADLTDEYIMPRAFDKNVQMQVAEAVRKAAAASGAAKV
jgi:malate dehydrogenase (oxaloacetate-decarboxylating)